MFYNKILLLIILEIAVFLLGYALGRRTGKKEGMTEGMSLVLLSGESSCLKHLYVRYAPKS